MTDITLAYDNATGTGDWVIAASQIATGGDLESAILVSLFTDRVAAPGYVPNDGTQDRRGWWGDTYSPTPWGSRLWQLSRADISNPQATIQQANNYVAEALQWMIDDGVASAIAPSAVFTASSTMKITVLVTKATGGSETFEWAWDLLAQTGI